MVGATSMTGRDFRETRESLGREVEWCAFPGATAAHQSGPEGGRRGQRWVQNIVAFDSGHQRSCTLPMM